MNLLDRIDRRLADARARINPHDFEECATSLLSPVHPGLAPIPGGSDFGLDAEITDGGQITGVVVTSSRTWDGARKSLRDSLRSMQEHGVSISRVVVANLAEVNRSKRQKLDEIASTFECSILQVYDRTWFANQFRENPLWRLKILAIEGGPFSLSRQPLGARPDLDQLSTIGRHALLTAVEEIDSDVTLFGVPGVGKSHVASKLEGALFLERHPTPERLLDDLIEARPRIVIVDDAGGRSEDLTLLRHLRQAENLGFRIVATCWPHETDLIADHLPSSAALEVELLTRQELGAMLRERGITRVSVIAHLLEQAAGRPAWALNLADLLIRDGDWKAVWTGNALREKIFAFLRMSNASDDAIDVLATLSLLNRIDEDQLRRMADLLRIRQPELMRLMRSVAIAGLVDVQEHERYRRETKRVEQRNTYRVGPPIIAASLASEVYFSTSNPPVRLQDVAQMFPEKAADILQIQIYATLLGAERPSVPTRAEVSAVLSGEARDDELLRSFGQLGPDEAEAVVELYAGRIEAALRSGAPARAEREAEGLAARIADSLKSRNQSVLTPFIETLELLREAELAVAPAVKALIQALRGAASGEEPDAADLLGLIQALDELPATTLSDELWITFASEILAPTIEGSYMSPEVLNQFVLHSFTWSSADMEAIYDAAEVQLSARIPSFRPTIQLQVIELLTEWVRIADGAPLPFGGKAADAQQLAASGIAHRIANALAPFISTPGVRARFNSVATRLWMRLEEPDALFAALTRDCDRTDDYLERRRQSEAALDAALSPFLRVEPAVLMRWVCANEEDLAIADRAGSVSWRVFNRLASGDAAPALTYLTSAVEHGLVAVASPLVTACARSECLSREMVDRLMADRDGRPAVIGAVIGTSADPGLVRHVVSQLTVLDVERLEGALVLREASPATRRALFTHPVEEVRGSAAAQWAAEWTFGNEARPQDQHWLAAMKHYSVPDDAGHGTTQSHALIALAEASPETLVELFDKHTTHRVRGSYRDWDCWRSAVRLLGTDHRDELWRRVSGSTFAHEAFWIIAGEDVLWIAAKVSDPDFPISIRALLTAIQFQFGPRFPIDRLALALRPLDPDPSELLSTLDVGTFVGEEHERQEAKLRQVRDLATSADDYLANIGRRGIEMYEPLVERALANARRAAVRGRRE